MNDYPGADAEFVLVVVTAVVDGGQEVAGCDDADREATLCFEVEVGGDARWRAAE